MRWVTLAVLADETGVPIRTLQHLVRHEPGVLVLRQRQGKREYEQPTCAIRLAERQVRLAVARVEAKPETTVFLDIERRRRQAQMEIAEMQAARMRGEQVLDVEAVAEVERFSDGVRAQLLGAPARYARYFPELAVPEAVDRLRRVCNEILEGLQRIGEEDSPGHDGEAAA